MVGGRASAPATAHNAACINTPVVHHLAHLVPAAVRVLLALHLRAPEGGAGVAHMLVKTFAERFVILHLAVGIFATFSPVTGVDTFPIAASIPGTGQLGSAVSVGCAFIGIFAPFCVGIAHQPSWTGALERAGNIGTIC